MIFKKQVIFIITAIFVFSVMVLHTQTTNDKTQKLTREFMSLNQELQTIKQKAYQDPAITDLTEELSDLKAKKMVEIDPKAKKLINEQNKIEQDYQKAQSNGNQEKMKKLQQEYQELNKKMQPLNQQVMQIEKVQTKQKKLQSAVMKKMQEIDPKMNKKIERLNEIQRELKQKQ